ncbi:MAG: FAD-binding protein [Clostridia bacterium]|nr:FAD-binding protein [Clostridia bacterium]
MAISKDNYDVVILGTGLSGLYAAYNLDKDLRVLVCSKSKFKLSNSSLAQGGVAAVLDEKNDNFDYHFNDTLIAGGQINNPKTVRTLVEEGPDDVRKLCELGVDFDKKPDGSLSMTLEGGHSRHRIVHHKDSTGDAITTVMLQRVSELENVELAENVACVQITRGESGFFVEMLDNKQLKTVSASFVVLATGGVGRVYKYTTNSSIATGDGIRFAYELGAQIKDLDYIQFHPTAFAAGEDRERFLISEAVRGEGAYLLNCNFERFMHLYDERLELAPRDKVSHSIMMEYRRTGSDKFYLDISRLDADFLKNRFPMIYERCLNEGVDLTKEPIPIFPCHHYLMGGIQVDENGYTGIDRLYAVGECANTGVHGKNRLASNSLLEALVFSRRAADEINRKIHHPNFVAVHGTPPKIVDGTAPLPEGIRTQIREIMQKSHFVLPDQAAAEKGLKVIEQIRSRLNNSYFKKTVDYCEAKSLATVAALILRGAINR